MAQTIRHPAPCFKCGRVTPAGKGYLHRSEGKWFAHCFDCYKTDKRIKRMEELLADAEETICGEFCGSNGHHPLCIKKRFEEIKKAYDT